MFEKFKAMATFMLAVLGLKDIPIENGAVTFSAEQKQKLQDALGEKVKLETVVTAMNQELADLAKANDDANDQELIDLRKEAFEMLKAHGLSQEDAQQLATTTGAATSATEKEMLKGLMSATKAQDEKIKKLITTPEEDKPLAVGALKNIKGLHSATHVFGTGNNWDAFEGRNWNKRAAGLSNVKTDFAADSKVEIQKLKDDVDLYYRENPTEINSLHRDLLGLPAFWNIRTNVDDKVADGNIVSGEISQGRKLPWLPKNKQLIQPEESKIFPVNIDIEHQGYYLQEIEASWLNFMNTEGSQPFKMSFVRFLLMELDKKARQEDRRVAINGVYVKTPEDATVAGSAINRGHGIAKLLFDAYFYDKKFRVANIGLPTDENIVDYVVDLIEKNVPEESKNTDDLVLYLSPTWLRKYKTRYRQIYGIDNAFAKEDMMTIEQYPNIRFQTLRDFEGSNFMFITFGDNIELMENVPGEKSMYRFDTLKRNVFIYADYKFGVRFKHIGTTVKEGDPDSFKVQTVWANMPPYIHDTFVPLYDDTTGIITLPYSNITFKSGWATNITEFKNTYENQIIKVKGATSGVTGTVTDGAKINLAGDAAFNLATGGTLTLRANGDGTVTEIKRTGAPESAPSEEVNFTGATIDANEGSEFNFTGLSNVTMTGILNGYDGQVITIVGSAGANTVTVPSVANNISVGASRLLSVAADFVELIRVDGVWTEIDFNIEA